MSRKQSTQAHIKCIILSDVRGKFKKCQICQKEFGLFLKEHQCKRCRRAVCQHCASHQGQILSETGLSKQQHRICNICKEESDSIKRFVEQNKLGIGRDTFSIEWLKASGLTLSIAQQEYEIAQKENNPNKDKGEFLKMKQELNMVMLEFWINLTYSFREFLFYIMKENEHESISQSICRVLGALLLQYPEIGYSSDQVLITMFLLCFCSEASAFALLTVLYAEIVPANTYPSNLRKTPYDYSHEIDKVLQVMEQAFKIKTSELQLIKPFIRSKIARYLLPLGVNFFMFQTSFYIINQMFLTPKHGYDGFLKCLAVAYSISFEEIKLFINSLEDAEGQILKNVKSTQIEKDILITKTIIFSPHRGVTQSVTIIRQSELWKQNNQIKPEHQKEDQAKKQQKQEEKMLEYTVVQDSEFQQLRRKTVEIVAQPQVDEEKQNLKQYIEKVEEALMLKHKLVTELQNRIKELQNQPPQIANKDADQQLLQANEQLRKRISEQDLEIQQLHQAKLFADKINEDAQQMIATLQKSNQDLESQLDSQLSTNRELLVSIRESQNSSSTQQVPSPLTPQRERNYQINISLQQKETEEQLQSKVDSEKQKVFQLEQQNKQLNKEYMALQQLNQDKLKIIGNLEVRLIELDAVQRENERLTLDIVTLSKKIEHHELVIIQQQEQLDDLNYKHTDLLKRYEIQGEEMDQVRIEKRQNLVEFNRKENELVLIIQDLRRQLQEMTQHRDTLQNQLNESLNINQQLQALVVEKDEKLEMLNQGILKGLRKFEELEIKHHKQVEEDRKKIEERDALIIERNNEIQRLKEELQDKINIIDNHKQEFKALKALFVALEQKWKGLENDHTELKEKHRILIIDFDQLTKKWQDLDKEHSKLSEIYRLIVIEFDSFKGNNNQKINEQNNLIDELQRKLKAMEDKYNQLTNQHKSMMERFEIETQNHIKKVGELDLRIIGLEKKSYEFKTLSENQKLEIDDLLIRIKQYEDRIKQYEQEKAEQHARHQLILQQVAQHLDRVTKLENHNSKLELEIMELEKKLHELQLINQDQKNQVIKQDEKIVIYVQEIHVKEQEIVKLIQIIESQKVELIDYEKLIRELRARIAELEKIIVVLEQKIVDLEKQNKKLRTINEQFKILSEEMAQIS